MKHWVAHVVQKYLLNPPIRLLFALQIVPPGYALLETVGRVSGKPRRTPVGNGVAGDTFWIVAEHGRQAGYVRNIERTPRVRLGPSRGGRHRSMGMARTGAVAYRGGQTTTLQITLYVVPQESA